MQLLQLLGLQCPIIQEATFYSAAVNSDFLQCCCCNCWVSSVINKQRFSLVLLLKLSAEQCIPQLLILTSKMLLQLLCEQ